MKQTFPIAVLALIITCLLGVSLASGLKNEPVKNTQPNISSTAISSAQTDISYILKDTDGYLGVYRSDSPTPIMILDTHISLLPEYDRVQLAKGVYAKDYSELTRLIEDYIS